VGEQLGTEVAKGEGKTRGEMRCFSIQEGSAKLLLDERKVSRCLMEHYGRDREGVRTSRKGREHKKGHYAFSIYWDLENRGKSRC